MQLHFKLCYLLSLLARLVLIASGLLQNTMLVFWKSLNSGRYSHQHQQCCVVPAVTTIPHTEVVRMFLLQRAIWEAEYQAHEWQQRLAQQPRFRSGQTRFNLTRHISMPTVTRGSSLPASHASCLPTSSCQCPQPCCKQNGAMISDANPNDASLPSHGTDSVQQQGITTVIRVPRSNSDATIQLLLPEMPSLSGLVSKSLLRTSSSSKSSNSNPSRSSYVRTRSTGTGKSTKRRVSDVGSPASKAYQPMLSIAAKARPASQSASALSKTAASTQQQQAVAAARVKSGNMERSAGLTSNYSRSAAVSNADQGDTTSSGMSKAPGKLTLVK